MSANLENPAVATGLEKGPFSFQSQRKAIPKNNWTTAQCAYLNPSKVMLKILQTWLQQSMNRELPDVQAGFRKGRGTRDQMPASVGSLKMQESCRKTSTSGLLTMRKPLTVDHNKLWKLLKEMGISDHLTCLLRTENYYWPFFRYARGQWIPQTFNYLQEDKCKTNSNKVSWLAKVCKYEEWGKAILSDSVEKKSGTGDADKQNPFQEVKFSKHEIAIRNLKNQIISYNFSYKISYKNRTCK